MAEEKRWTELSVTDEGISVTLYEPTDNNPKVVDEVWYTHDELDLVADDEGNVVLD